MEIWVDVRDCEDARMIDRENEYKVVSHRVATFW